MPILRHELTLIARRQHVTFWRCVVALGLASLAAIFYYGASQDYKTFGKKQIAEVTQYVALALYGLMFMVGAAVTPQWTADAVAGEKERQTLPFLLLTPLDSRSIILGKLASRLVQVGVFLLAGMPVLIGLQFFGGIDPDMVLLGTIALAVTVVSSASVSVLASVYQPTTKAAAQRGGQAVAGYVFGMMIFGQLIRMWPQIADFPSKTSPVTVYDLFEWVNVGNPVIVVPKIVEAVAAGGALSDVLVPAVRNYVLFHALVTVGCCVWAIRQLRPMAAQAADGPPPADAPKSRQPAPRPPVDDRRPVTWKMLHCDQRLAKTNLHRTVSRILFVIAFLPLALVIGLTLVWGSPAQLPQAVNVVLRGLGTLGLVGSLLHIAGQAASSVARERVKLTLDELLLTDLSTKEILGQKWLGAVLCIRWVWVWIALHWAVGLVTGALHPLAVPPLIAAWVVYACAAASLGVYCTATCTSMKNANLWAIALGFATWVGPIIAALILLAVSRQPREYMLMPALMSPPVVFGFGAFSWEDWNGIVRSTPGMWSGVGAATIESAAIAGFAGAVLGLVLNGFLAVWWWRRAVRLFPRSVGRE